MQAGGWQKDPGQSGVTAFCADLSWMDWDVKSAGMDTSEELRRQVNDNSLRIIHHSLLSIFWIMNLSQDTSNLPGSLIMTHRS
jgi:hypothetical protein